MKKRKLLDSRHFFSIRQPNRISSADLFSSRTCLTFSDNYGQLKWRECCGKCVWRSKKWENMLRKQSYKGKAVKCVWVRARKIVISRIKSPFCRLTDLDSTDFHLEISLEIGDWKSERKISSPPFVERFDSTNTHKARRGEKQIDKVAIFIFTSQSVEKREKRFRERKT